jgi:cardiolipin synthase
MSIPLGPRIPLGVLVAAGAAGVLASTFGRAAGRWKTRYRQLEFDVEADLGGEEFLRLAEALAQAPVLPGNEVELLVNGDEVFPAMLETISSARRTLNVLTYIYWQGDIAEHVADAIAERAAAGVECRILLDAVGARRMPSRLRRRMADAGATVALFRPVRPGTIRRLNNRTHRRALIADGVVGMTGGVGIAEEWTGDAQDPDHWRDDHLRLRGPVVRAIQGAFAENWLETTGEPLCGEDLLPDIAPIPGGVPAQLLASSPNVSASGAEKAFFLALAAAARTIDVQASYFAPPDAFTGALVRAAERGVRVRVMCPGAYPESTAVRDAGRAAYSRLLEAGIEVYEYDRTTLHAKAIVADGVWSLLGTANFDHRSLSLNEEVALGVQDRALAARLTECFERDLEGSRRIDPDGWARRGPHRRIRERAALVAAQQL